MNLEDRIASGAFTLIAEIGVNYYDIARQRGISLWRRQSSCAKKRAKLAFMR